MAINRISSNIFSRESQNHFFQWFCVVISEAVHLLIKNQTFPAKARWDRDGSILGCSEIKLFEKLWENLLNISIPMLYAGTELN